MQTSISGVQSGIHGGLSFQPGFASGNTTHLNKTNTETENSDKSPLQSEATKLQQKALNDLSKEDQVKVQKLKNRDTEVKAHEQAHLSAAGGFATGGASFSYTSGPNGVRYAIGGEVGIDTSPVPGDPAATIRKADIIRRAALAPISPSAQDHSVANNASAMAAKARADLMQQTQELVESDLNKPTEKSNNQLNPNDSSNKTASGSIINFSI